MSVEATAGEKHCCKCSKDVTHSGRMKDSDGRYWCIDCGQKDEGKKKEHAGATCKGCGEPFAKPQLTWIGGLPYCDPCIKRKFAVKPSFLSKVWSQLTGSR